LLLSMMTGTLPCPENLIFSPSWNSLWGSPTMHETGKEAFHAAVCLQLFVCTEVVLCPHPLASDKRLSFAPRDGLDR
jgi:hypothetical protein